MGTVPKILLANAAGPGGARVAMREKSLGIWQGITWARQAEVVRSFACGLAGIGFSRGDRLAIIGDNRPRLYQGLMAAQCLGGVPVALHPDSSPREVCDAVARVEATVALAEDQEQVDKLLAVADALPHLRHIVYSDVRGMRGYDDPALVSFDEIVERGRRFDAEDPGFFEVQVAAGEPDDIAVIAFTAGTTGPPKPVPLTYRNLFSAGESLLAQEHWRAGEEEAFAYLPMAWVGEVLLSVFLAVEQRITVNIPESPETVPRDLREIGPTVFFAPGRVWDRLWREVQRRIEDSSRLKRRLFHRGVEAALDLESRRAEGRPVPFSARLRQRFYRFTVYTPLLDQLGLRAVRHAYAGGSALSPGTLRALRGIGVDLRPYYGLTECSGVAAVQAGPAARPEAVGRPLPGVEVRISPDGEVLVRSGGVFAGYFGDPAGSAPVLDEDGWLHTGDSGHFDEEGQLVLLDRADDIAPLADGTPFAPRFVESKLRTSPYIRDAVAVGAGRPHVAAMVSVDVENLGRWAARRDLDVAGHGGAVHSDAVYDLLEEEVRKVNEGLPDALAVKGFLLLPKELDADAGEVTRLRTLRRGVVHDRYRAAIEALYAAGATDPGELASRVGEATPAAVATEVLVRRVGAGAVAEAVAVGGAR